MNLGAFASTQAAMIAASAFGLAGAAAALIWSKYPVRWILAIATVVVVVFILGYRTPEIDAQLPSAFRDHFRLWLLALGLVAAYSSTHVVATLVRRMQAGPVARADDPFADIQSAWDAIKIQLSQARIDPSVQDLYLLLGPEEALASSVVEAAGLQFFARGSASADAPIHAHATADALFLSIAGASTVGRPGPEGTARLEFLCRLIAAENPERPTLRGVAVLVPFEWARRAEFHLQASAIRDDLVTIRRSMGVRCPTLTVCCLQESIPGFNDFAARLPSKLRQNRCGFSVPIAMAGEREVIRRGMLWMSGWFQAWSLNLMVADIGEQDGNSRLLSMNVALRESRDALVRLLESGLTMHQQAEPVLYRGCYFVACGPTPDRNAFAAGLLSGARKGRLLADRDLTAWSRESDRLDRTYRRLAWAIGLATAGIAAPIWYFEIIARLPRGQAAIGWAALAALALLWAAALLGRRPRKATPAPPR